MERNVQPIEPKGPKETFLDEVIRPLGVSDAIVDAFARVDRAEFAPEELRDQAYNDAVITLGRFSSISQPSLVATMIETLELEGNETVLEIGTATGFQASLLSLLSKEVHTIDVNSDLCEQAKHNTQRLGYKNITVHTGDGAKGVPGKVFDRIIITAAVKEIPPDLISQLSDHGIIVAPVGKSMESSCLTVYTKSGGGVIPKTNFACAFVPLVTESSAGWTELEIADNQNEKLETLREEIREYLIKMAENYGTTFDILMENIITDLGYVLKPKTPISEEQVMDVINIVLGTFAQLQGETEADESEED